jgi:hypothetical protein
LVRTEVKKVLPGDGCVFLRHFELSQRRQGIRSEFVGATNHGFDIKKGTVKYSGVSFPRKIVFVAFDVAVAPTKDLLKGRHKKRGTNKNLFRFRSKGRQHGGESVHKGTIGSG